MSNSTTGNPNTTTAAATNTSSSSSSSSLLLESQLDEDEYIWTSAPLPSNPTDNNNNNLAKKLQSYEQDALHCFICHQFYNNPVTLVNCQHSFCSECLLRNMSGIQSRRRERCCPVCNDKIVGNLEKNRVKNWALQIAVDKYREMRQLIYEHVVIVAQGLTSSTNDSACNAGNAGSVSSVSKQKQDNDDRNDVQKYKESENYKSSSSEEMNSKASSKRQRRSTRNLKVSYDEDKDVDMDATSEQHDNDSKNMNTSQNIATRTCKTSNMSDDLEQNENCDSNSTPTMRNESPSSIPTKDVKSAVVTLPMSSSIPPATHHDAINPSSFKAFTTTMTTPTTTTTTATTTATTTTHKNNNISTAMESRSTNKMKPMAMILLHGIKKKKLISMLEKHGLPTYGSDEDRKNRYKHFVELWNSECCAMNPRSENELVNVLVDRERQEKCNARRGTSSYEKKSIAELKANSNFMSGFDALIQQAQKNRKSATGTKRQFSGISQQSTDREMDYTSTSDNSSDAANDHFSKISNFHVISTTGTSISNPCVSSTKSTTTQTPTPKAMTTMTTTLSETVLPVESKEVISQAGTSYSITSTPSKIPSSSFHNLMSSNSVHISNSSAKKQKTQAITKLITDVMNHSSPSLQQQKGDKWNCYACTFANTIMHHQLRTIPKCAMCYTPRDRSKETKSPEVVATSGFVKIDC